ncbi:branched-chain amino acid ABC transporter substrate-binding protein [Comamonas testosteroni]|uniref:branched-chain amino acid ABC transporter substrate-binding protein n=1 Tax=Comamonas testosteroni TaxID=285 RepID=UPI0015FD385F|nr:branched-chain amino acid ABC transporter substrate-binding protein [Comamonas testosteroni]
MSMTDRSAQSRRVRTSSALSLALVAVSLSAAFAADAEKPLVVRIAHGGPLSGPIAALGKDEESGVRMAIDELNARKLQLGGRPVYWKLEAGDDVGDPGQATALARRFCDKKVAAVVGHLQSGTTLPAAKIYNDCGIPNITPAATNPAITEAGYDDTFRVIANDRAMVNALLDYAVRHQGVKRIAIVDDRTAYGQGIVKLFEAAAAERDVQIVDKQYTSDKATQFSSILTAIKGRKPDAIFFGGLDAQAGLMLRQMSQLAMNQVKFLGGDAQCSERLPAMADKVPALKNVVCVMSGSSLGNMPGGLLWKQKYDQRFPGQYQVYSPYAYDATMVLAKAMLSADSAQPEAYLPRLRQTRYEGVTGTIAFDSQGELQSPRVTLYGYDSGERKELVVSGH